jgi:hypothetical protein
MYMFSRLKDRSRAGPEPGEFVQHVCHKKIFGLPVLPAISRAFPDHGMVIEGTPQAALPFISSGRVLQFAQARPNR